MFCVSVSWIHKFTLPTTVARKFSARFRCHTLLPLLRVSFFSWFFRLPFSTYANVKSDQSLNMSAAYGVICGSKRRHTVDRGSCHLQIPLFCFFSENSLATSRGVTPLGVTLRDYFESKRSLTIVSYVPKYRIELQYDRLHPLLPNIHLWKRGLLSRSHSAMQVRIVPSNVEHLSGQ